MAYPVVPGMGIPVMPLTGGLELGHQLIRALENNDEKRLGNILDSSQMNQISADLLGRALIFCIQKKLDPFYATILNLPNSRHIPANGEHGLGRALIETVRIQDPTSLELIQEHPNFNNIDAGGEWGLCNALTAHLQTLLEERNGEYLDDPNPKYLNAIIGHPRANQIQFSDNIVDSIGELLLTMAIQSVKRFNTDDKGVILALLHPNIAHLIQPNGTFGLGRVLMNAAWALNLELVHAILSHPNALRIDSQDQAEVDRENRTEAEEYWSTECFDFDDDWLIDSFGFSEAIFAAVHKGNPPVKNIWLLQSQIVIAILNFANSNRIELDANGPLGLVASLTAAAEHNQLLVPIILNASDSTKIEANADDDEEHGGLSDALLSAGSKGHLIAITSILNHPKAKLITTQNLQGSYDVANENGHEEAAELIYIFGVMNNRNLNLREIK